MAETSTKPYMLRALHEWCTDNGYTPQIVVQVDSNTLVPPAHVRDGQITLNIGALATNRLVIGNEAVEFQARFNGITENLYVPIGVISAIFARETGAGMGFEVSPTTDEAFSPQVERSTRAGASNPTQERPALASVRDLTAESDNSASSDSAKGDGAKSTEKQRPKLSIVK